MVQAGQQRQVAGGGSCCCLPASARWCWQWSVSWAAGTHGHWQLLCATATACSTCSASCCRRPCRLHSRQAHLLKARQLHICLHCTSSTAIGAAVTSPAAACTWRSAVLRAHALPGATTSRRGTRRRPRQLARSQEHHLVSQGSCSGRCCGISLCRGCCSSSICCRVDDVLRRACSSRCCQRRCPSSSSRVLRRRPGCRPWWRPGLRLGLALACL